MLTANNCKRYFEVSWKIFPLISISECGQNKSNVPVNFITYCVQPSRTISAKTVYSIKAKYRNYDITVIACDILELHCITNIKRSLFCSSPRNILHLRKKTPGFENTHGRCKNILFFRINRVQASCCIEILKCLDIQFHYLISLPCFSACLHLYFRAR